MGAAAARGTVKSRVTRLSRTKLAIKLSFMCGEVCINLYFSLSKASGQSNFAFDSLTSSRSTNPSCKYCSSLSEGDHWLFNQISGIKGSLSLNSALGFSSLSIRKKYLSPTVSPFPRASHVLLLLASVLDALLPFLPKTCPTHLLERQGHPRDIVQTFFPVKFFVRF